ncbi:hypothetical protein [Nocardia brasiliensis]|uniref:hypothetical protein n=1 Tax=Nocardia brasiliensis TaxID=37326 RepID=UPI001893F723|nr:hypothetical protein [Nocardia brasiliensis]MBF6543414.1 hypothetical protein [Nocardia brasiliensis]
MFPDFLAWLASEESTHPWLTDEFAAEVQRQLSERDPGSKHHYVLRFYLAISPVASRKSMSGYDLTENYRLPAMPWEIKRDDIAPLLRRWHADISSVEIRCFGAVHGVLAAVKPLVLRIPVLRDILPAVVQLKTSTSVPQS